jgi:hypothetical protein
MTQHDIEDRSGSSPPGAAVTAADMRKLAPTTRADLLKRAKRDKTPIRKTFVQHPQGAAVRPSVLSTFVNNGDDRGLKAYLFLMAITSSGDHDDGWSTTLPLAVWARAFNTVKDAELASATSAVSKILTRLEQRRLIERHRTGRARNVRVTICREDGSGDPYTHPAKESGPENHYLSLPHVYWTGGWHEKLSLAATAMLLVALHATPVFTLPTENMQEWYGWSPDTAERGFDELVNNGLLKKTSRRKPAPLAPLGFTTYNEYELIGPFKRTKAKKTAAKKTAAKKTAAKKTAAKKTAAKKTAGTTTPRSSGVSTRKKTHP